MMLSLATPLLPLLRFGISDEKEEKGVFASMLRRRRIMSWYLIIMQGNADRVDTIGFILIGDEKTGKPLNSTGTLLFK